MEHSKLLVTLSKATHYELDIAHKINLFLSKQLTDSASNKVSNH